MNTLSLSACCLLAMTRFSLAANPTWTLHPKDAEALKQSGISVSYRLVVNDVDNPEYAFTITAKAQKGIDAMDAYFSLRNEKGLIALQTWSDSAGTCVAGFTVGKQALKDAGFLVQLYRGKRTNPFSASGCYAIPLFEFAADPRFCAGRIGVADHPALKEVRLFAPIQRDGSIVTVHVKPKEALSNYHYDLHVTVEGRAAQRFHIRNGQPVTKGDVRLADLNGDGFLDIMLVGGSDHRGRDWFKTLIYDRQKNHYRWLGEPPDSKSANGG